MRNDTLRVVHTRPVYNIISSGALTINTSAYTANDYLCTNYITYTGAFLEQTDAFVKIIGVRVRESITSGTLQKPALNILFFDECDIATTANGAFDFGDGTNTDIDNIMGQLAVTTLGYDTITSGGNAYNAIANAYFVNPIIVQVASANRYIKAIPLTAGTPTFGASTILTIDLIVEMI
jgi:hypothetical protein